jgi:hypothetical protein
LALLEEHLDQHRLQVRMAKGNWLTIRRNGRTKMWKTRPGEFRIPIKFGFRGTGALTHFDYLQGKLNLEFYRVNPAYPAASTP